MIKKKNYFEDLVGISFLEFPELKKWFYIMYDNQIYQFAALERNLLDRFIQQTYEPSYYMYARSL